jgi:hypothetical protein
MRELTEAEIEAVSGGTCGPFEGEHYTGPRLTKEPSGGVWASGTYASGIGITVGVGPNGSFIGPAVGIGIQLQGGFAAQGADVESAVESSDGLFIGVDVGIEAEDIGASNAEGSASVGIGLFYSINAPVAPVVKYHFSDKDHPGG